MVGAPSVGDARLVDLEHVAAAAVAVYHRTGLPYETVERAAVLALEMPDDRGPLQLSAELERRVENIARFLAAEP